MWGGDKKGKTRHDLNGTPTVIRNNIYPLCSTLHQDSGVFLSYKLSMATTLREMTLVQNQEVHPPQSPPQETKVKATNKKEKKNDKMKHQLQHHSE